MKILQGICFALMGVGATVMWTATFVLLWSNHEVPWWNEPLFLTGAITGGMAFGLLLILKGQR